MTVRCGTGNPGKLREFRLAGLDVEPLENVPPPDETGHTFEENAIQKAVYYSGFTTDWLFADDSGLEVDALEGAPGIHSARFAGPDANAEANNALLLERLKGVENRGAQFICVIALARQGSLLKTFRGVVRGRILDAPRGTRGFGYDPLFFYDPFGCTFGEADLDGKMHISHRAQALRQMAAWLENNATSSGSR